LKRKKLQGSNSEAFLCPGFVSGQFETIYITITN